MGFGWHFIRPIILLVVYYVVFTGIRTSAIENFWIFLFSSLFPFSFMLTNLIGGAGSIVNNAGMVKKIYFPREIIVLSQVISSAVVMLIGYGTSLLVVAISGYHLTANIAFVPIILALCIIFAIGCSLFFSAISVYSRDVMHLLNSVNLVIAFSTPVFFISKQVSGILNVIIWFNPLTYYVEMLHSVIYYGTMPETHIILIAIAISLSTLFIGQYVFDRLKGGFAERL